MAEPFEERPERRGMLGRRLKSAASQAIETLLARAESVRDVAAEAARDIARSHDLEWPRTLRTPCTRLYRRFFEFCLVDLELSDEERGELAHLRALLAVDPEDAQRIHEDVVFEVYGRALDEVLADNRLDPDEQLFLAKLRSELDLSADAAERLLQQRTEMARQRYLSRTVARSNPLLASSRTELELTGHSASSVEAAIRGAVDEAGRAVPDLSWAKLDELRANVRDGQIDGWTVKLRAGLRRDADTDRP